jgi:hypothetical protein
VQLTISFQFFAADRIFKKKTCLSQEDSKTFSSLQPCIQTCLVDAVALTVVDVRAVDDFSPPQLPVTLLSLAALLRSRRLKVDL